MHFSLTPELSWGYFMSSSGALKKLLRRELRFWQYKILLIPVFLCVKNKSAWPPSSRLQTVAHLAADWRTRKSVALYLLSPILLSTSVSSITANPPSVSPLWPPDNTRKNAPSPLPYPHLPQPSIKHSSDVWHCSSCNLPFKTLSSTGPMHNM